jgi:hypothetical protein
MREPYIKPARLEAYDYGMTLDRGRNENQSKENDGEKGRRKRRKDGSR